MRVALLLTLDPGLEREIEKAWSGEILLTLDSVEAVSAALQTLETRPLLIVDSSCFPPPRTQEADILCIGEEIFPGFPLLERPVRASELQSIAECVFAGAAGTAPSLTGVLPSPFSEFQRDTIHDLNNQFTTLQGNLLLLREDFKDPALDDMATASAKALKLIQWLEWLGEGKFSSVPFELSSFLMDLAPLLFRLRNRTTPFTVIPSASPVYFQANPQHLLALLLVLTRQIPGTPTECILECSVPSDPVSITCSWPCTGEEMTLPEIVSFWASSLSMTLSITDHSWTCSTSV